MSNYENAPATALLATSCAVCNRPLLDAKSVELGIGPTCRKKWGFDIAAHDADRERANQLVHAIATATKPSDFADNRHRILQLRSLGFVKLADKLDKRFAMKASVTIVDDGGILRISAPYDRDFVDAMRAIDGRWFSKASKVWNVPGTARRAVWDALRACYPGKMGTGPKGDFMIAY